MGKLGILLLLSTLIVVPSNAGALTWYLQNVTFDDGTAVTGSFSFDASTGPGTISSWDITVLASVHGPGELSAYTYTSANSSPFVFDTNDAVAFDDNGGTRELDLNFDLALTNAGGTISLDTGSSERLLFDESWSRNIATGDVTTDLSRAPEPAPAFLAGGALALVAALKMKRRRNSLSRPASIKVP